MRSSAGNLNLLALDTDPFDAQSKEECSTEEGNGRVEGVGKCLVIGPLDTLEIRLQLVDISELSGSAAENQHWVDLRSILGEVDNQLVVENILTNGKEQSTTKCLREDDDGNSSRNIFELNSGLSGNHWLLHDKPDAGTSKNLVANPLAGIRVHNPGGKETSADCSNYWSRNHEGDIIAQRSDDTAANNGEYCDCQNKRDIADARLGCRDALDSLEPDRDEKDQDEKGRSDAKGNQTAKGNAALAKNARRQCSRLTTLELDKDKDCCKNTGENE